MNLNLLTAEETHVFIERVVLFWVIIVATAVTARLSRRVVDVVLKGRAHHLTVRSKKFASKIIWFFGVLFAISQLGLSLNLLMLTLTLAGLAMLLGAREVFECFFARSFLDFYSQYRVGDTIEVEGFRGKVIEINSINTELLTKDKKLVVVPNKKFIESAFVNKTLYAKYEISIPIVVDSEVDIVEFEGKLLDICKNLGEYIKKTPKPIVATTTISDESEQLALIVTLKDIEYKNTVIAEVNDRVKKLLDEMHHKRG